MDSLIFALSAVAPIVLTVVVGYFFKKIGMMDEDFAKKANKLVFRAFMPVMLFVNIYKMKISDIDLGFIGFCLISLFVVFGLAVPASMIIAGKKDRVPIPGIEQPMSEASRRRARRREVSLNLVFMFTSVFVYQVHFTIFYTCVSMLLGNKNTPSLYNDGKSRARFHTF